MITFAIQYRWWLFALSACEWLNILRFYILYTLYISFTEMPVMFLQPNNDPKDKKKKGEEGMDFTQTCKYLSKEVIGEA